MVPSSSILDAGSLHILEQLKYGKINIRQAAELLKVEPTILAYELAAKVFVMILTTVFQSASRLIITGKKILRSANPETPKPGSLIVIVLSCPQIGSLSSSTANQRAAQNNYWALGC